MNENETMLQDKNVYLCMESPNERNYMDMDVIRACKQIVMQYEEEYRCRPIAPHAVLPELLNYENPRELELSFWVSQKLLSLCSVLVVVGDCLSDRMRVEIDYAWLHDIPIVTRPESFAPVHEYLDSIKRRNEDAQHV